MISYRCTDSSGDISTYSRYPTKLRWWLLRVGVSLASTTSELNLQSGPITGLASDLSWARQNVRLYGTFVSGLCHSPPPMKNQHGRNEEKNLNKEKWSLNWVLVMWHMWLVWILTTKRKSFGDSGELWDVWNLLLLLIVDLFLITRFFCYIYSLSDLFFKRFYSLDIHPFNLFRLHGGQDDSILSAKSIRITPETSSF